MDLNISCLQEMCEVKPGKDTLEGDPGNKSIDFLAWHNWSLPWGHPLLCFFFNETKQNKSKNNPTFFHLKILLCTKQNLFRIVQESLIILNIVTHNKFYLLSMSRQQNSWESVSPSSRTFQHVFITAVGLQKLQVENSTLCHGLFLATGFLE